MTSDPLRRAIFSRMAILLVALIVAISAGLGAITLREHRQRAIDYAVTEQKVLAEQAVRLVLWDDRVALHGFLNGIVARPAGYAYAFIERNGRPHVDAFAAGVPRGLPGLHGGGGGMKEIRDEGMRRIFDFATPIGQTGATLRTGLARDEVDRRAWPQIALIAGLAALALGIALLLARYVVRAATREVDAATMALADSEDRYRLVTDSVPAWIGYLDRDLRYRFANRRHADLDGAALPVVGRHLREVIGDEAFLRAEPHLATAMKGQEVSFEDMFVASGETRRVVVRCVPDLDDAGRVRGLYSLAFDETERLDAEDQMGKALAAAEAIGRVLRLGLDSAPLDAVLGETLREILSLPWLRIERRGAIFLFEEGRERLRMAAHSGLPDALVDRCREIAPGECLCGAAALSGEIVFRPHVEPGENHRFQNMVPHGHYCVPIKVGGRTVGVLNAYLRADHPHDADEEGFLAMMADTLGFVIARKQADVQLQQSRNLSRALMDASIDAAFLIDPAGRMLAANGVVSARFGKPMDELVGANIFDLFPPALAEKRRTDLGKVLETRAELRMVDERQGLVLDNHVVPILDEATGAVSRIAVFSRDITEQRQAEEKIGAMVRALEASNAELRHFAYLASHDLQEPLRTITTYVQLLERRYRDRLDEDAVEFIGFAADAAKRMQALIKGLLEYSRVDTKGRPLAPTDLERTLGTVLDNLRVRIAESAAEVSHDPLPMIDADDLQMTQLFQNLIGNALKYCPPDRPPRVHVGAERRTDGWEFSVRDNGIGIMARDFERIFLIFQRLHTAQEFEGTGIGLAVCRKIVERHGGKIWVESEPGKGSAFRFTLSGGGKEL